MTQSTQEENQQHTNGDATRPRRHQPIIEAVLNEGQFVEADSWIEFRPLPDVKKINFRTRLDMFVNFRDALRLLSRDSSWSLRYASQIKFENMPFLHSSQTRTIMFDPFMAFRDPLREFAAQRSFIWQIYPSNSYFFKMQREVHECEDRLALLKSLEADPGTAVYSGTPPELSTASAPQK